MTILYKRFLFFLGIALVVGISYFSFASQGLAQEPTGDDGKGPAHETGPASERPHREQAVSAEATCSPQASMLRCANQPVFTESGPDRQSCDANPTGKTTTPDRQRLPAWNLESNCETL